MPRSVLGILVAALLQLPVVAQLDDRIWLTGSPSPGGTNVFEIGRDGTLLAAHAGPVGASLSLVKDPFLGRTLVADELGQRILVYESGVGLVDSISAPDIRSLAVLSNGNIALLRTTSLLAPGLVQVLTPTGDLVASHAVGLDARRLEVGPRDELWTVDRLGLGLTLIKGGVPRTLRPNPLPGAPLELAAVPDGRAFVTFQNSPLVLEIEPRTQAMRFLTFPEVILGLAADGDRGLWATGLGGGIHRLDLERDVIETTGHLPVGDWGQLFLDGPRRLWLEETTLGILRSFAPDGTPGRVTLLPAASRTIGDPVGWKWACVTAASGDADLDSFSSASEIRHGSDPLDFASTPALLGVTLLADRLDMTVTADASVAGSLYGLTFSLDGDGELALGPQRDAPYVDIGLDGLAVAVLGGQQLAGISFMGIPTGFLDARGVAAAAVGWMPGFATASLPPIYASAAILDPTGSRVALTTPRILLPF